MLGETSFLAMLLDESMKASEIQGFYFEGKSADNM